MTEESRFMSFGGVRLHMRVAAPEDAPRSRVLLLSSPLLHSFHWRKLVPELTQDGCLTVVVDLPGFGRSDCGPSIAQSASMRAHYVWGVLDSIDEETGAPNSVWHLCAHGSACSTVMEMAEQFPDSVRSQIHISPIFMLPAERARQNDSRFFEVNFLREDGFRAYVERLSGYPLDDYILDRMRAPFLRPGARESFLRMLKNSRSEPQYSLGFCPAMAILGGIDPLLTPAEEERILRCLKGAELHRIRNAGHLPTETHSKALRDYLRGWLRYNQ